MSDLATLLFAAVIIFIVAAIAIEHALDKIADAIKSLKDKP